jgi:hypothetical protein
MLDIDEVLNCPDELEPIGQASGPPLIYLSAVACLPAAALGFLPADPRGPRFDLNPLLG